MRSRTVLAVVAAAMLALSSPVGATPVTIINPGFEDPAYLYPDENHWDYGAPTGWTKIGTDNTPGRVGTWLVDDDDFDAQPDGGFAPQGQNVAFTETPHSGSSKVGLGQILDRQFAAGRNYTLTVEVGNSWDYYFSGYKVELWAGETLIAQDRNTLHPGWREWETSTAEYIYDPFNFDDSLVGELLEIRLLNLGRNPEGGGDDLVGVEFDNVRLENDTIPTPEPATMLLLGTGLIGLAGFGRKKLFRK